MRFSKNCLIPTDQRIQEWEVFQTSIEFLSSKGILGLFNAFQIIEILAFPPKEYHISEPINIYSIFTCSDVDLENFDKPVEFVNRSNRIVLNKLKGWSFGIAKYNKSIDCVKGCIETYVNNRVWSPTNLPISTGELIPLKKQYVASDSFIEIALNKIIKNNFLNGSYVLELCGVICSNENWELICVK
ncbi:hypothetical protein C1N32_19825 [Vibrio diazotrophicus]|jgi:hypothetical protein|uniref:Uncharacterized protein n=1 Tax=Vibrio diazotrophicus TaxID=685 RepID=A0A2J8HU40_VIBDI|nr:hypothetical protein [Vibrio diazotrophicus]PNI01770.1 hypothetical protein C1N32_19825 [Vibrio diazotrophicus]RAS55296.1 hypothetical protein DET48_14620 [Vibrio diazotrophicus]